jgi:DNA-binding CsgD family transcriptional regulator/PAS domain-containing protein
MVRKESAVSKELELAFGLIDTIYGAALDEAAWVGALDSVNRYLGGSGAALFFVRGRDCHEATFVAGLDPQLFVDYAADYFEADPKVAIAFDQRLNRIITDLDVIEEREMDRNAFYAECLARYDLRYCLATAMGVDRDTYAVVTSLRGKRQGAPGKAAQRRLALLVPHLRRALQLRSRRLAGEAERRGLLDTLSALVQGVVLVARDGLIVWANPAAEAMLKSQDGLQACRQRLGLADAAGTADLRRLIAAAAQAAVVPEVAPGGVLAAGRPSLRPPYQLLVLPLPRAAALVEHLPDVTRLPVAAVFIADPVLEAQAPVEHLARLHGLTPAEARLAAALAAGVTLKDFAQETRLSLNYVRWLLKQVEGKTGTHSRQALVQLLTRQIARPAGPVG